MSTGEEGHEEEEEESKEQSKGAAAAEPASAAGRRTPAPKPDDPKELKVAAFFSPRGEVGREGGKDGREGGKDGREGGKDGRVLAPNEEGGVLLPGAVLSGDDEACGWAAARFKCGNAVNFECGNAGNAEKKTPEKTCFFFLPER